MKLTKKTSTQITALFVAFFYIGTLFSTTFLLTRNVNAVGGQTPIKTSRSSGASQPDSGLLQFIAATCYNMKKVDGSDIKNADKPWYQCEKAQDALKKSLGCNGQMFFAKQNPDVPTATLNDWYTDTEKYAACYAKAKSAYEAISGDKCKAMQHGNDQEDGPEWKDCEKLQSQLAVALGCSQKMFTESSKNGVWTQKPAELSDCNTRLTAVGNTKLPVAKGTPDKTTAEIATEKGYKGSQGEGDPSSSDGSADCDAKLSSPLSWIICPVVDIGSAFTDTMFKEVISPLLENVPISTDENDGGYIAWQQFRLLGNILLIGSLLAIVYAQIKGGR